MIKLRLRKREKERENLCGKNTYELLWHNIILDDLNIIHNGKEKTLEKLENILKIVE